ncbi:unnamed protein product [Haemonchus placei]|uniref:Ribosome assembly factor mrt4 n=1 Tax=Haemonchus placei TaxID=6290 RepID=A0A0N4WI93_HAEPC|nr:unnamed protein product [Haemonchus placei]
MFCISVSLTKVKKKTREVKEALVKEVHYSFQIRHSVDKYKYLFVFTIEDMRSTHFIQVRQRFKTNSRFFFGKNNVMAVALGKDASSEYAPDLHKVSQRLQGQCGLMFTLLSRAKVNSILKELSTPDFARAGHIPRETITVPEGPLPQFSFSMEPQLRKLGLPTKLDKGLMFRFVFIIVAYMIESMPWNPNVILEVLLLRSDRAIVLYQDYDICKEGEPLTAEQAKILKLFGHKLAEFKINIVSQWDKEDGYRIVPKKDKKERLDSVTVEDS